MLWKWQFVLEYFIKIIIELLYLQFIIYNFIII